MGGRISVESVVRCSWNGWPDDRGIRTVALKTTVNSNKLIETQVLAAELESVVKMVNSMWQDVREGVEEQQRLFNSLHGLSLATGERRGAKLDEICARHENTQVEGLLRRLLG
ncbi:hypothetical protein LU675_29335, partial [Pseudomonas monteilii]|nr:hypothetical protein [Pseudomonas monteilii]